MESGITQSPATPPAPFSHIYSLLSSAALGLLCISVGPVPMGLSGVVISAFEMGGFKGGGFLAMNQILAYTFSYANA